MIEIEKEILNKVRIAKSSTDIYKDECCLCFDTPVMFIFN